MAWETERTACRHVPYKRGPKSSKAEAANKKVMTVMTSFIVVTTLNTITVTMMSINTRPGVRTFLRNAPGVPCVSLICQSPGNFATILSRSFFAVGAARGGLIPERRTENTTWRRLPHMPVAGQFRHNLITLDVRVRRCACWSYFLNAEERIRHGAAACSTHYEKTACQNQHRAS